MSNKNLFTLLIFIAIIGFASVFLAKYSGVTVDSTTLTTEEEDKLLKVLPYGDKMDFASISDRVRASNFRFPVLDSSEVGVIYKTMFER